MDFILEIRKKSWEITVFNQTNSNTALGYNRESVTGFDREFIPDIFWDNDLSF